MRIFTAILLAVCLLLAGYVAADLRTSDNASAGTTWRYEMLRDSDQFESYVAELPGSCKVEFETIQLATGGRYFLVISACPD